jgi:hypothetical protein
MCDLQEFGINGNLYVRKFSMEMSPQASDTAKSMALHSIAKQDNKFDVHGA